MNWNKGFEARYYMTIVDAESWRDLDRIEITGGSISRQLGELIESADIECVAYDRGEQWVRVWLDARQNGASEHIPLFTGLATSPADNFNGSYITNTLECYSVLKPCQDVLLPRGWYVNKGGGEYALADLLSISPAPVSIADNCPKLKKPIIAEQGETNLSMVNKVLLAINWRIRITGNGTIEVCPQASGSSASFGTDYDIIEPTLSRSYDWYKCPNVFRAISGNDSAVAVDDGNGILSVQSRGREIWKEDSSANLNEGETLYEYALRRLKDEQITAQTLSYDRRFIPDLTVTDIVDIRYPNIYGKYYVTSQRIEIGYGAKTTEEVAR